MAEILQNDVTLTPEQLQPIARVLHDQLVDSVGDLSKRLPFKNGCNNDYKHFISPIDPESFIGAKRIVDPQGNFDTVTVTIKHPTGTSPQEYASEQLAVTVGRKPTVEHSRWTSLHGEQAERRGETSISNHLTLQETATTIQRKISEFGLSW